MVVLVDFDAEIVASVSCRHNAGCAAAAHRIEDKITGLREAHDEVFRELVRVRCGMLQLRPVAFGVACRVLPQRSATLHVVDGLGLDLLEAAVGQAVGPRIHLASVLGGDHERRLVEVPGPVAPEEDQNVLVIDPEPLGPPRSGVSVPLVDAGLEQTPAAVHPVHCPSKCGQ